MSKKVTDKSKNGKNKKPMKKISMVPLLYLGVIMIVLTMVLNQFIDMPNSISNIMYLIGVAAFVVYMLQVAFEKRTGKEELTEDEIKAMKKAQKMKSK